MNHYFRALLCLGWTALAAAPQTEEELKQMEKRARGEQSQHQEGGSHSELLIVQAPDRAKDLKDAFDHMQKITGGRRLEYKLKNGKTLVGISEVTLLSGGTMLMFKMTTTQGLEYAVVPVEDIAAIKM